MKELIILSGKGGTGKTSISAALAHLYKDLVLVDADVDAANLHLIVDHKLKESEAFSGGIIPVLDPELCINCGICWEYCVFDAISPTEPPVINPLFCESCGVCHVFCPTGAISVKDRISGDCFYSESENGPMFHAKLGIAEENSGKLVSHLRQKAKDFAQKNNYPLILVDGPPGIACPVIASITGADLVLIVTEPSLSGRHDMLRLAALCKKMSIPLCLSVNKWDLNPKISEELIDDAKKEGIFILPSIPFDSEVAKAVGLRTSFIKNKDSIAGQALRELWEELNILLKNLKKEKAIFTSLPDKQ